MTFNETDNSEPQSADPEFVYDVFISHASEDKGDFVRPLAEALQREGLRVWYDEFTLRAGDSLRGKIDEGLRLSRFGIVVVSPDFFAKRWPTRELNGLTTLEISDGSKRIIPIWHNVNQAEVAKFSPTLADVHALNSAAGLSDVVKGILLVVNDAPRAYNWYHEDATVDVVAIARQEGGKIVRHAFKNCMLYGPALLASATGFVMLNQHLDIGQVWPLEVMRPYLGQIDLVDCRIEHCTFDRVGFAVTPKLYSRITAGFQTNGPYTPSMPNMSMYSE